jgi:hypothetical protein
MVHMISAQSLYFFTDYVLYNSELILKHILRSSERTASEGRLNHSKICYIFLFSLSMAVQPFRTLAAFSVS